MAWLKGILEAMAAVKAVASLLAKAWAKWEEYQDKKIDKHYDKKKKRRTRLARQIEVAKRENNDAELIKLHRLMRNLESDS